MSYLFIKYLWTLKRVLDFKQFFFLVEKLTSETV